MKEKITIVIPTHNRHTYLTRLLDYYLDVECRILIADSSNRAYTGKLMPHMQYFYYPNMDVDEKLFKIVSNVKTEYMLFCADDDFWIKSSIQPCLNFLEKNPNYSCVHGKYIIFKTDKNTIDHDIVSIPWYLHANTLHINSNQIEKRVNAIMNCYMPTFYALNKTNIIFKALKDAYENKITHPILVELLIGIYPLIAGKYKTLNHFTYARDVETPSIPLERESLDKISTSQKWAEEYNKFQEVLIKYVEINNSELNGKHIIKSALTAYIQTIVSPKNKFFAKYILFFKSLVLKLSGNSFIKLIGTSAYPNLNNEATKSWLEIKRIIKNAR